MSSDFLKRMGLQKVDMKMCMPRKNSGVVKVIGGKKPSGGMMISISGDVMEKSNFTDGSRVDLYASEDGNMFAFVANPVGVYYIKQYKGTQTNGRINSTQLARFLLAKTLVNGEISVDTFDANVVDGNIIMSPRRGEQ